MNRILRTLFFIICCPVTVFGQNIVKSKPFGLNMSGGEFNYPGIYPKDYQYPGTESLDYARSKGFKLIRLQFLWERIQPVLKGELDTTEADRIIKVIDEAKQRGIMVLLDMHNYCRRSVNGTAELVNSPCVTINDFADAWYRIAMLVKSKTNIWGYGLMNEPHDMPAKDAWFNIAQAAIARIRVADNKTAIVVGGNRWSSAASWLTESEPLKNLNDPSNHLIFEAHVYFDDDASGIYKATYDVEKTTPLTGVIRVSPFISWLKSNKLQGFVGEYGIPGNDPRWLVVLDNFLSYLQKNKINGTYWAAGPIWGNYILSVEPKVGADKPQMQVLSKYLSAE